MTSKSHEPIDFLSLLPTPFKTHVLILYLMEEKSPWGEVTYVLDNDILESEFELQLLGLVWFGLMVYQPL